MSNPIENENISDTAKKWIYLILAVTYLIKDVALSMTALGVDVEGIMSAYSRKIEKQVEQTEAQDLTDIEHQIKALKDEQERLRKIQGMLQEKAHDPS